MADVNEKVTLNTLLDFYGPLLTERRGEVVRLYCEEDLSYSEIAEQMGVSRQAVSEAIAQARRQLNGYEEKLGLAARYRGIRRAAEDGLRALEKDERDPAPVRQALETILSIER